MLQPDQSNLIDLDNENEENVDPITEVPQPSQVMSPDSCLMNRVSEKRDSLDNNPFDKVSKQVDLQDDPFESVAREAEQQRRTSVEYRDVETVNLLGLDDEPEENKSQDRMSRLLVSHGSRFGSSRSNALSSISSLNSLCSPTLYDDSVFSSNVSPIRAEIVSGSANSTVFNNAFLAEKSCEQSVSNQDLIVNGDVKSIDSSQNTSFHQGNSWSLHSVPGPSDSSNKLSGEISAFNAAHHSSSIRTHLLKLSLSNSSNSSPYRRGSKNSDDMTETTVFTEAGCLAEQFSKVVRFDDSCDDINALRPNWVDSETEQDSDLELLRIPMLDKIGGETKQQRTATTPSKRTIEVLDKHREIVIQQMAKSNSADMPDLEAIRDQVKRHKLEKGNSQDVDDLINSLKRIVFECPNGGQKTEANKLLENLSTLLCKKDTPEKNEGSSLGDPDLPPSMIRQGTFDLDKSQKEKSATEVASESEDCTTPSNFSSEVTNIAEQIGKLLGNQSVNVVQANFGTSSTAATNPTYIVVMGGSAAPAPLTPVRQKTKIICRSPTSPDLEAQKRFRSHSLSLHDKPIKRDNIPTLTSPSVYKTPIRSGVPQRRSSFSYSPSLNLANTKIRRSIYERDTQQLKTTDERCSNVYNHNRNVPQTKVFPKNISNMRSDLNVKSLKLKSNEITRRTTGPLKATIPVKKVAPMIITPSVSSPIDAHKKSNLITSTPIPDTNSLKFPAACSTPGSANSPKNGVKSKLRHSFLSATPNPKSTVKPTSSTYNRRRSLTDSKSPKRSSTSTTGSTRISIGGYQSTASNSMRRFPPSKLMNYLQGRAASKSGSGLILEKNKENTHPK